MFPPQVDDHLPEITVAEMKEWITGRNPVYEVLHGQTPACFSVVVARGVEVKGRLRDILRLGAQRKLAIESVDAVSWTRWGRNHQGVALETSAYRILHWWTSSTWLKNASNRRLCWCWT
jgi:hypothetical protein